MTSVVRSKDCGNSPKNQLVERLAVAIAMGDQSTVSALVTDDVRWGIVGGQSVVGREAVLQALPDSNGAPIVVLTVLHVVTHGKAGAVDGTIQRSAGSSGFCDVFEFSNVKGTSVSSITSYRG